VSGATVSLLVILLLLVPLCGSAVIWLVGQTKSKSLLYWIHGLISVATSVLGFAAVSTVVEGKTYTVLNKYLLLDPLGGVFITIISLTGLLVNLYSIKYIDWELKEGKIAHRDAVLYFSLVHLFIFTMILSVVSNNIIIMWAAVDATTLSSVFLVALYKNKRATEAGWKYIVICSIGLAFALYGSVLMYGLASSIIGNAHEAMLWTSLMQHAKFLDPDVMKIIFVLVLLGYGTKAGLAPNYVWLPDAHSEGPSPVSALLSAVLLKCAMAAIVRFYAIAGNSPLGFSFPNHLLLSLGVLSILIAGLFILKQADIKRLFAYSSVENLGVIAFGLGVGGPLGIFAALFHALNHSITKALAFCSTGNLYEIYGTRDMTKMGGLVRIAPITTFLIATAIFSLMGTPPLAVFTSEFFTIKAGLGTSKFFPVVFFLVGLAIVFTGLISHFNEILFGTPRSTLKRDKEVGITANLPLIVLAFLVFTVGILAPDWWINLLKGAVKVVNGGV